MKLLIPIVMIYVIDTCLGLLTAVLDYHIPLRCFHKKLRYQYRGVVNQILPNLHYMYSANLPHYVKYILTKTNNYHVDHFILI